MIKIDIISGFLGAGKTTLIQKLFKEAFKGEKIVLIENEFGEIGIDGGFLKESGVNIKEINSGCICCSLVGDFASSLREVIETYEPERIIIEPSGVGKLSDIKKAVLKLNEDIEINILATVVDGSKTKMYIRNFGEFFNDQVKEASTIVVSRVDKINEEKLHEAIHMLKDINKNATIISTDINLLDGEKLLDTLDSTDQLPKTVVYSLNPKDNESLATICNCFNKPGIKNRIQYGSAWWFNDQLDGMRRQMTALANMGMIANFVGMLTDSRSFLSYPRHDYFRRLLCSYFGELIENGDYPANIEFVGQIIQDICYNNAKEFFFKEEK